MSHIPHFDWKIHTHVGLDLDETLASSFSGLLRYSHTQGKLLMCQSIDDFTSHDIFEDPSFDLTREDMISLWQNYGMTITSPRDTPLISGAREGVDILRMMKKEYSIITARNGHDPIKKKRTLEWLKCYFPEIPENQIHFVNHYIEEARPKSDVCKAFGITLLIDDHIENARDLCEKGISIILLEKPWNRDIEYTHPLLHRVGGWGEIITSLR